MRPRQFPPASSATEPLPPDLADCPIELPEAPGIRRTSVILVVASELGIEGLLLLVHRLMAMLPAPFGYCRQAPSETLLHRLRIYGKKTVKRKAYEKSPAFKEGQRFRAGIEGRISVLFRGRGMKRCLAEGRQRFEVLVGAAVLANNLMRIAAMLSKRSPRRRRAA